MALSQCLDEPQGGGWASKKENGLNLQELYNERHRLALEELLSGGVDRFLDFLGKERIPNFLSDEETHRVMRAAVVPRLSAYADGLTADQSACGSVDCSSLTYFPEMSDLEPPVLEIGWPSFTKGSYRGVTRAVAHFQPSFNECVYSCKEAARRMIRSAKEVIAIVTDSLTDLDIFKDLQDACTQRKVPVYILLDQSCAPAFLKMCRNISVRLDDLQKMRVRTITGITYFMRSGARITGQVHERFMLIDGNRVATGSYRFNWTDGKLNSSNLIELSGQITENFDEEFRILYGQSVPLNTQSTRSPRNSGLYDSLLIKHPVNSIHHNAWEQLVEPMCVTSTPTHKSHAQTQPVCEPLIGEAGPKISLASDSSTIGDDLAEQHIQEELLAGSTAQFFPTDAPAIVEPVKPPILYNHISTQTSCSTVDSDTQTDIESPLQHSGLQPSDHMASIATTHNDPNITQDQAASLSFGLASHRQSVSHHMSDCRSPICNSPVAPESSLKDCFQKLSKERQYRYSAIRTKLEHMVTMLSQRRELVDITNSTLEPGTHRRKNAQKEHGQEENRVPLS
ncbi:protein FAM83D [Lampris incognitus]|uniref:protein FAM83D n=1 Tax=Lampris incognitus TaxID=2546036 RepID=UPI0024B60CB4|nr:protein FAM83D [Lampris incognitus]